MAAAGPHAVPGQGGARIGVHAMGRLRPIAGALPSPRNSLRSSATPSNAQYVAPLASPRIRTPANHHQQVPNSSGRARLYGVSLPYGLSVANSVPEGRNLKVSSMPANGASQFAGRTIPVSRPTDRTANGGQSPRQFDHAWIGCGSHVGKSSAYSGENQISSPRMEGVSRVALDADDRGRAPPTRTASASPRVGTRSVTPPSLACASNSVPFCNFGAHAPLRVRGSSRNASETRNRSADQQSPSAAGHSTPAFGGAPAWSGTPDSARGRKTRHLPGASQTDTSTIRFNSSQRGAPVRQRSSTTSPHSSRDSRGHEFHSMRAQRRSEAKSDSAKTERSTCGRTNLASPLRASTSPHAHRMRTPLASPRTSTKSTSSKSQSANGPALFPSLSAGAVPHLPSGRDIHARSGTQAIAQEPTKNENNDHPSNEAALQRSAASLMDRPGLSRTSSGTHSRGCHGTVRVDNTKQHSPCISILVSQEGADNPRPLAELIGSGVLEGTDGGDVTCGAISADDCEYNILGNTDNKGDAPALTVADEGLHANADTLLRSGQSVTWPAALNDAGSDGVGAPSPWSPICSESPLSGRFSGRSSPRASNIAWRQEVDELEQVLHEGVLTERGTTSPSHDSTRGRATTGPVSLQYSFDGDGEGQTRAAEAAAVVASVEAAAADEEVVRSRSNSFNSAEHSVVEYPITGASVLRSSSAPESLLSAGNMLLELSDSLSPPSLTVSSASSFVGSAEAGAKASGNRSARHSTSSRRSSNCRATEVGPEPLFEDWQRTDFGAEGLMAADIRRLRGTENVPPDECLSSPSTNSINRMVSGARVPVETVKTMCSLWESRVQDSTASPCSRASSFGGGVPSALRTRSPSQASLQYTSIIRRMERNVARQERLKNELVAKVLRLGVDSGGGTGGAFDGEGDAGCLEDDGSCLDIISDSEIIGPHQPTPLKRKHGSTSDRDGAAGRANQCDPNVEPALLRALEENSSALWRAQRDTMRLLLRGLERLERTGGGRGQACQEARQESCCRCCRSGQAAANEDDMAGA